MFLRRLLITIGTAATLCGVFALYSEFMRPLIPAAPPQPQPVATVIENEATRPVENVRIAETYLAAQQPWTTEARYLLRSAQGAFLYTNDWQPEGKEGRIRLSPFAMAWISINKETGLEEAVTVVSESASLKFSGTFDLMSADAGRVIGAALEGRTRVTGPNGLMFDGRNFHFSESSSSLWSEQPVTFTYAGNKGNANRFQADLIPQSGPPDRDRPHIFGVRTVRLIQNVQMDLQLKQKNDPIALKLRCSGNFEYNIPQQTAKYEDKVVASRETAKEEFDWIECDRLTVLFGDPETDTAALDVPIAAAGGSPEYQKLNRTWKFRRLQAERFTPTTITTAGKKVPSFQLHSMQNKLRASFRQLIYDGEQQLLLLRDDDGVKVVQAQTQMQAPEIMVQLAEGQKLAGALCRGEGWINFRDSKTNTVLYAADWKQHLRHVANAAEGIDLIELADTASFRQPNENSALGAELIRVWTTPLSLAGNLVTGDATPKPTAEKEKKKKLDVQLRRLEATQDVVLVSPQLEGRCQKLEAVLDTTVTPRESKPGTSPLGAPKPKRHTDENKNESEKSDEPAEFPIVAAADQIRLRLVPTTFNQPEVAEVWIDGQVTMSQQHGGGRAPLAIKGDHVHLQNNGGNEQIADITGTPATVRENGLFLEAGTIHLDRADNQMGVEGKGLLQLPVKNDLDGKPLPAAQPLEVTWKNRMAFDGRTADFRGSARAEFGERRIQCERMEVILTERLSFTERAPRSKKGADPQTQLAAVHCYDDVKFHDYTRDGTNLVGIQQADVWEMHIDRVSGEMTAQGPGRMQMWQRGQGHRAQIAAPQAVRANAPTHVDATEWEYTFVKFDGRMEGNLHRRHSTFRDRCEIIHGPVKHPQDILNRDNLPKAGGLLKCQVLEVMQAAGVADERGKIQLLGKGDADLEGYGFVAKADQIAYDEAKKSYTLRGVGKNLARVWHQETPGAEARETALQWMEFYPATNTFRAVGITGADAGR